MGQWLPDRENWVNTRMPLTGQSQPNHETCSSTCMHIMTAVFSCLYLFVWLSNLSWFHEIIIVINTVAVMLDIFFLPFIYFTSFTEQDKADITPNDGRCQWDSNLRTPARESPTPTTVQWTPTFWLLDICDWPEACTTFTWPSCPWYTEPPFYAWIWTACMPNPGVEPRLPWC